MSCKTSLPIFLLLSNTYTGASKHTRKGTHMCKRPCAYVHTKKETYSHTRHSVHSNKLPSHSIWFVISFSALIISQYLGHSPLIVSRVLRSALLSHPDGLGTQTSIRSATREGEENFELLMSSNGIDQKSPLVRKSCRGRMLNGRGYESKFYLTWQNKWSKVRINAMFSVCGLKKMGKWEHENRNLVSVRGRERENDTNKWREGEGRTWNGNIGGARCCWQGREAKKRKLISWKGREDECEQMFGLSVSKRDKWRTYRFLQHPKSLC